MIEQVPAPKDMLAELKPGEAMCPECGHADRTRKVSTVVRQGGGVVYFPDSTERVFLTDLARTLARPEPPQKVAYWRSAFWLACSYLGLAVFLVVAQLAEEYIGAGGSRLELAKYAAIMSLALAIPGLIIGTAFMKMRIYDEAYPAWQAACEQWRRLYYCERDDSIFFRDEEIPYAPDQMTAVIYATHSRRERAPSESEAAKAPALEAVKANGETAPSVAPAS
jgi:hypothetical protein